MFSNRYFPHALFAVALSSVSINLVSQRKSAEDERARVKAQLSILQSIKEQLQSDTPISNDELERLKKLARSAAPTNGADAGVTGGLREQVSWSDIFRGRKPTMMDGEQEVSKWDKQDLEKMRKEMAGSR
ncbi:hypothetical protein B0H34DRAFT_796276 [Crassisporium funariophilum]|nr:hypothetical protein B0H34DRAFT_796276 [Crassisporium funariophilum]